MTEAAAVRCVNSAQTRLVRSNEEKHRNTVTELKTGENFMSGERMSRTHCAVPQAQAEKGNVVVRYGARDVGDRTVEV